MKEKTRFLLKSAALVVFFYFMGGVIFAQCAGADPFPNEAAEETITANGVKITRVIELLENSQIPKFKNGKVLLQEHNSSVIRGVQNGPLPYGQLQTKHVYKGNKSVIYRFDKPIHSIQLRIDDLDSSFFERLDKSYSDGVTIGANGGISVEVTNNNLYVEEKLGNNFNIYIDKNKISPFHIPPSSGPEGSIVTLKSSDKNGFTFISIRIENKSTLNMSASVPVYASGVEGGFTVAICENSVVPSPVTLAPFPNRTVCEGGVVSFTAQAHFTATHTTSFHGEMKYELQQSKNKGIAWENITNVDNLQNNESHTFQLSVTREKDGYWYRIKYSSSSGYYYSFPFDLYSEVSVLSVTYADVKQITATPNSLGTGATPVQFKVVGTPNATVKYTLNNGSTESVTLNAQGIGLVNKTLSATTIFKATEVSLSGCDFAVTNKSFTIAHLVGCSSLPTPDFKGHIPYSGLSASVTTENGINIIQHENAGTENSPGVNYCDNISHFAKGYVKLGGSDNTLNYSFSEPVTSAQLWFLKLGKKDNLKAKEKIIIAPQCNGYYTGSELVTRIDVIYTCGEGSIETIIDDSPAQQHLLAGYNGESTVGILVTAETPFKALSIRLSDNNDEVFATLCSSSLISAAEIVVQPENQSLCAGETLSVPAKYDYKGTYVPIRCWLQLDFEDGFRKKESSIVNLRKNTTQTLTIANLPAYPNDVPYRIAYEFRSLCGGYSVVKYSKVATLTIINPTLTVTSTVVTYCQGQTPAVPIGVTVSGTGSSTLSYQWYRNPINSNTGGTLMVGATGATYTPSTATVSTLYYYVVVTSGSCNIQKTSNPIQVKVVGITTPTVTAAAPFCPTATDREVSFATYVTAAVGHRLYWYSQATGGTALTQTPTLNTKQTGATTVTYYVSQRGAACESERVPVTLSVQDTTPPTISHAGNLTVACTNEAAISTWLNRFTATDTCGTATLTHNYGLVKPANLCEASTLTITFTARDGFANQTSTTATLRLLSISAANDANTGTIDGAVGANNVIDVLANDRVERANATTANCTLSVVRAATAIGGAQVPSLNTSTGKISVPAGTASGTYYIVYQIKATIDSIEVSATATATVIVGSTPLIANNVTYTILDNTTGGTTSSVLNQISLGGVAQHNTTLVSLSWGAMPTGFSYNADGTLTVAAGTRSGTYTVRFTACERLNTNHCATATATVIVRTPSLTVNADSFTYSNTAIVGNILTNDRLGSRRPQAGTDVSITVTNSSEVGYPQLDAATGNVSVNNRTAAGTYVIPYKVCRLVGSTECFESTATVIVPNANTPSSTTHRVIATDDDYNYTNNTFVGNVLSNDTLNGTAATGRVSLSVLRQPTGTLVPTIDSTGNITVPVGVATGTYLFEYRICAGAGACDTAVATVYVGTALIVNADSYTYSGTAAVGNVLDNDRINGHRPQIATEVTLSVPAQPVNYPVLEATTGGVTVGNEVAVGTYTISYQVCRVSNGKCVSTTLTVIVPHVIAKDDANTNYINGATGATNVIDVLANDQVGRQAATLSNSQLIVITTATPIGGANVPVLSTATGKVNVPAGTAAGTYYIVYELSAQVGGNTVKDRATVTVEVGKTPLTAANAHYEILDNTMGGTTTPTIFGKVSLGGVVQTDNSDVTLSWGTMPTGFTGNNTNGILTIVPATATGTYQIPYTVCERLNSDNCKTATVTVEVLSPTLRVNADRFTYSNTAVVGNILTNDTLGARTPVAGTDVTITVTNSTETGYPQLDPATGNVSVNNQTTAGSYLIHYTVCRVSGGTECFDSTATVIVPNSNTNTSTGSNRVVAADDDFNYTNNSAVGNVLTNDTVDGTAATGRVSLTILRRPAGTNVPTINSAGDISVPSGVATGTYLFEYRICANAGACDTAVATVYVGTAHIVRPDTYTYTSTATMGNVLDNDRLNGRRPQIGTEVTLNVPTQPANYPVLHPITGQVSVQDSTPAGIYTISYQVCRVSNGKCVSTTLTVIVPHVMAKDDANTNYINGATGAANVIDALANDQVERQRATTSNSQLAVITPATPIGGGNIPELSTATGKVNVPAGTTAGTYYIIYELSTQIGGNTFKDRATITVEVGKTPLTAANASYEILDNTLGGTTSPSIFGKITLGGVAQTDDSNVILSWGTMPTGFTGNNTNGTLTVVPATLPGTYEIPYTVCERLNSGNCKTATATVKVFIPTLTVNADNFTYSTTAIVGNILSNDRLGNRVPAAGTDVRITVTNSTEVGYPQLDPATGNVSVNNQTTAGSYTIPYTVCRVSGGTECFDNVATVVVPNGNTNTNTGSNRVVANDDDLVYNNQSYLGNVLTNDTYEGNPATGHVQLTVIQAPIGSDVPTIDSAGNITAPVGIASGTYTFEYRICAAAGVCDTAIATVYVGTAHIVRPDIFRYRGNAIVGNVLDNDSIDGHRPTIGTEVTLTVPAIPANQPILDPGTGEVTVPEGIPAGTYTLTYHACRVSNGKCVTTTLTVLVPYIEANDDAFTYENQEIVGNVLTNDKVNNTTPVLSSNIQLVVLSRPAGVYVPTLDAQGNVHIGNRVQNGTYTFTYQLSSLNPAASDRATVVVTVPLLTVNPDTFTKTTVSTTHNILANDRIDNSSQVPTMNDVEITILTRPSVANPPVLDPATGNVSIPEETPAGTYIITYRMCTKAPLRVVVCATSTVTVIVPDASQLAKAEDDYATTVVDTPVRIAVLANDTPSNATPSIISHPTNGTATVNPDGTISYQPNSGFIGKDTFAYQISDNFGNSSTANVRVDVVKGVHPHNGLSPDDKDGVNDYFIIKGIEAFPNNVVKVFNRWGVKVFEVKGYNNRDKIFDGTSSARATMDASGKLPQGTYYYVIELNDPNGKESDRSGFLYLKRQ